MRNKNTLMFENKSDFSIQNTHTHTQCVCVCVWEGVIK